ncbi:UMP-CMP kinase [Trichinella pseudospiralis]
MPPEGVLMVEPNYCVKPSSFAKRTREKTRQPSISLYNIREIQLRPVLWQSAGDLLRAEQNRPDSPYSKLIEQHIKKEQLFLSK